MDYDDDFFLEEDKLYDYKRIPTMDGRIFIFEDKLQMVSTKSEESDVPKPNTDKVEVFIEDLDGGRERLSWELERENKLQMVSTKSEESDVPKPNTDKVEVFIEDLDGGRERLSWELERENKLGMTVTSGSVTLEKNDSNLIGISIGGGAKYCPCLYIVQVFDNTAASREGTLQSGDEICGVNGTNVKGKSKQEVAQMIQKSEGNVTLQYNKLHADPKQGKSLDIALKKMKHRVVENLSSSTADALGLSRAILCNDSLVKKLEDLQRTETMYRSLVEQTKRLLKAFYDLTVVYKKFGNIFCKIGVREVQQTSNEAFNQFGEAHRQMEKYGMVMIKRLKPILSDLGTYLTKAIPDTKLTIKRYADIKFEYLSYCLKVKEMDDEELQFAQLQEPLYRVETGNYEYRLILRCRQEARSAFAKLRSDVMVKLELLDSKHAQHLTDQLRRLITGLASYHTQCQDLMHDRQWFPIELDLVGPAFSPHNMGVPFDLDDDALLDPEEEATEATDGLLGDLVNLYDNEVDSSDLPTINTPLHQNQDLLCGL